MTTHRAPSTGPGAPVPGRVGAAEGLKPIWVEHPDLEAMGRRGFRRFQGVFGREPEGIWMSPGRANLNGEHIDFLGGRCLPMALPYGTLVAAAPRTDGLLRMRTLEPSLDAGIVEVEVAGIGPGRPEGWTGYVAGALWALHIAAQDHPELAIPENFGADLLIRSTLPMGGGLSSSAALECAAILAFVGMALGRTDLDDGTRAVLARACMMAEVEVVGAATGGLDQTASLRSRPEHILSLDCRDFSIEHYPAAPLLEGHRLVGVDTNTPHWLGGDEFSSRRKDAEAAARFLGAERLRDLLPEAPGQADVDAVLARWDELAPSASRLEGHDPGDARRRLRHALTEMLRSERIDALLRHGADPSMAGGAPGELGRILSEGHASMRDDAEASFATADLIVAIALRRGATGARLIGGGFGGSVLALLPELRVDSIVEHIDREVLAAGLPRPRFLCIEPSSSGRQLCRECV
ncbi:galactokinase [Kocuria coralli]|uniref:Galactokinase n=1 Tax=Kocuria coralli TaxID=1461025 RepID=A0A5J5KX99_9MICC|nr:galactokinase family protein [Kocuria coralli]KAA9394303.1 galactokinase [Kocuria coralli]